MRQEAVAALLLVVVGTASCGRAAGQSHANAETLLRVGHGLGTPTQAPASGVGEIINNIAFQALLRGDREGRTRPLLAASSELSSDHLLLTLHLRGDVTFHDGSPANAEAIATSLRASLPRVLGPIFEDIDEITASGTDRIVIRFRRPSPFVVESLAQVPIQKPGNQALGTGPFMALPRAGGAAGSAEMVAYPRYYLGPPTIDRILINTYASERAAWADLLRNRLDMVYEVRDEQLESAQRSTSFSLYTFERPFQYVVLLNTRLPKLRSREVRQALNQAIDRQALVRDGLAGQGTPSTGPISQHHWAYESGGSAFSYAPQSAAALLARSRLPRSASDGPLLTLKCLVLPGAPYERLSLILKQQLEAVGVLLDCEDLGADRTFQALAAQDYEAVLVDVASGWNLWRPYGWWHSRGNRNPGFSDPAVDASLDRVRRAASAEAYRSGVVAFQRAIADDPPAIFLAWGSRSRAVTRGLDVHAEAGRDVLSSLRLWQPPADNRYGARN
jgi:peptide/nickel transport system substrate-binding protein